MEPSIEQLKRWRRQLAQITLEMENSLPDWDNNYPPAMLMAVRVASMGLGSAIQQAEQPGPEPVDA